MKILVGFFDAEQNIFGFFFRGFRDIDRLKSSLQRLIFLDVFFVFGKSGGAN